MMGVALLTMMFVLAVSLCVALYAVAEAARRDQRDAEIRAYAAIAMLIAVTEAKK